MTHFSANSLYGILLIGFGSVGNNIACRYFWIPFIAIACIAALILFPYVTYGSTGNSGAHFSHEASMLLGLFTLLFHFSHVLDMLLPTRWTQRNKWTTAFFGSDGVKAEARIKRAASHKINLMTSNALELAEIKNKDVVLETHFGQGLMAFANSGKSFEPAGGIVWTWKRIFNRTAFNQEGIWLSARLVAANITQFIVTVFILIAGIGLTRKVATEYDLETAYLAAGEYVELIFNHTISPHLVVGLASNFSLIVTDFVTSAVDLSDVCTDGNYSDISQAGCELVGQYFNCDAAASSVCTLLDYYLYEGSNSINDGLLALGLLNATGFKASEMLNAAKTALMNAADSRVNSIYPASRYM